MENKRYGGLVRADLKEIDAKLDMVFKKKNRERVNKEREEWEIDETKEFVVNGEIIGRGTYGSVHRGLYDQKQVAVKVLDWGEEGQEMQPVVASFRKAFLHEVSIWHKLEHPNIVKLIGATNNIRSQNGEIRMLHNFGYVVIEYMDGGTLKSYLFKHKKKKLPFDVVMKLALGIARGLSYLHSQNIVHRDVKTENILLDKEHNVKLTDFGVARFMASNPNEMTGHTGTLQYMAPEVYSCSPYDHKCDVYSFGICLWQIYCCDMPYPDRDFSKQIAAIIYEHLRPKIPRCCPKSLGMVMRKCWDPDPKKRPEMEAVVRMLEDIDVSKGTPMTPVDQPQGWFSCLWPKSQALEP